MLSMHVYMNLSTLTVLVFYFSSLIYSLIILKRSFTNESFDFVSNQIIYIPNVFVMCVYLNVELYICENTNNTKTID